MNNVKKCTGKESFQRMNYLYQLSNELATEHQAAHIASSHYSNLAISISKKAVQRLDVEIKRTICKGCRAILLPGITCKVRIKKKKIVKACLKCGCTKVFDTRNKDYNTWSQKLDNVVEVLEYASDAEKSCNLSM